MRNFSGILVVSLLMVGAASPPCIAQFPTYSDLEKGYLDGLAASNTPIFIASCATHERKLLAIVPVGAAEGKLVELSWHDGNARNPVLANIGTFAISGRAELRDLAQGGPGTWRLNEEALRNVIKLPFTLVLPAQFSAILGMRPGTKCAPHRDE